MDLLSNLQVADRINIFRQIAVNELNDIRVDILDSIATSHFNEFNDFCDRVFKERDKIDTISCSIIDGDLEFSINYK